MPSFDEMKSTAEINFRAAQQQPTEETTPALITPEIEGFVATLGAGAATFLPVQSDQYGLFGWCSDGVEEKMKHDGGTIRYGWAIWEFPRLFLTAEFHAVWVNHDGALIDITPKPHGQTRILFVPDANYEPGFNFDNRPRSKRARIYRPEPANIAAMIESLRPAQRDYEQRRATKAGVSLSQWMAGKQAVDNLPAAIDEFIAACDAHDVKSDSFPGPWFTPDQEMMDLMDKKDQLIDDIRYLARQKGLIRR